MLASLCDEARSVELGVGFTFHQGGTAARQLE
jgi:hypothetical protein